MTESQIPRVWSIPPGCAFLPTLAQALAEGRLVPGFKLDDDPLALADVTIYVPTRRAARALRTVIMEQLGRRSAVLPVIRPLGEFDEDSAAFDEASESTLALDPPVPSADRLLMLAPLVRAWKRRLPAHVAQKFAEEIVVPASSSDAIWLSRDLSALMDEIETEGSDWTKLAGLVTGDLSGWWQVTLDFLTIVTTHWPEVLKERGLSNPAAHRNAMMDFEAKRLLANPPPGPVIAAGSTGSIPATARLLSAIARLPKGAVVLPGLDRSLDARSFAAISAADARPAILGHPQYGLAKLIRTIGVLPGDVEDLATAAPELALRARLVAEALRPAETTDDWSETRGTLSDQEVVRGLAEVSLVEAANERDEAAAIALALRRAIQVEGRTAALVTTDRNLARRVAAELGRFGIQADDSGGVPLSNTAPATLLRLMLSAALRPGDPVSLLSLLKHPLLGLSLERGAVRHAAETIELVVLRGGVGRPDIGSLSQAFEERLAKLAENPRKPFWLDRLGARRLEEARAVCAGLEAATAPLAALRGQTGIEIAEIVALSVTAFEALGRSADGGLDALYDGDAGQKLAEILRGLVGTSARFDLSAEEWPDVADALIAPEAVKPARGGDRNISIWGALEARLQSVDTLVLGGLNEGSWPRKAESDRFMSRMMKGGIDLEPPERRIGLAAHDFQTAMGAPQVVLTRSARAGDAPAVPSRWLQRLTTFAGKQAAAEMKQRGETLLHWARALDAGQKQDFALRPNPRPPVAARPTRFSVTEVETLRRDPYAVYAKRILGLMPIDPLVRDPGAAERGTLFHDILHLFSATIGDPRRPEALDMLLAAGRASFDKAALPPEIDAVWWPRFARLADDIVRWERERAPDVARRHAEERAHAIEVGASGATLSGRADRIDLLAGGMADILDYKTGSSPSKAQAHTLLSPQLALEAALLRRGAFRELGAREPSKLAFVRLRPNGKVFEESILEYDRKVKSGIELAEEAWARLEALLIHYHDPESGYLSRALPFREGETDGDYDHLARVLEWSAGGDAGDGGGEE